MTWLAALSSGLMLFASDHPLHLWWLLFVALVPLWWALVEHRRRGRWLWPLGLIAAAANVLPLLCFAGTAPPIVAAAALALLQWPITAMLAGRVLDRGAVLGPLAAAAVVALGELAVWHSVPLFGTAQCFARPLSAAPAAVGFVAFTGVAGLVFALAATQALLVAAMRAGRPPASLGMAGAIVAVAAALDVARWTRPLGEPVRVAAAGWAAFPGDEQHALDLYQRLFDSAGQSHARLLVTPEAAAAVDIEGWGLGPRDEAAKELAAAATQHGLFGAIGVFRHATNDNRIWFVGPDRGLCAEYRKAHLIPWLEDYVAGDGALATVDLGGTALGGMICHDDNFTDVARAYGRAGVRLLAVPTNDWPAIREYHLENGIFRAIESGYAIVRAASNGISALISPRGEVIARFDHVDGNDRVLIDDVATGDGAPTVYARFGDWPVVGLMALLLAAAFVSARWRPALDAAPPRP